MKNKIILGMFLISVLMMSGMVVASEFNCRLLDFQDVDQNGDDVCSAVGGECLFSFGSIYYKIKESSDGSCSGETIEWVMPEPTQGGLMFSPQGCSSKIHAAELFGIPAFNIDQETIDNGSWGDEIKVVGNGAYCFKADGSGLNRDIWVSGSKTTAQALCCGLPEEVESKCTDSDGGMNSKIFGEVSIGSKITNFDKCISIEEYDEYGYPKTWNNINSCSGENCYLAEAYCRVGEESDDPDAIILDDCPNGCEDGACKTEFQENKPKITEAKPKITTAKPEVTQGFFSRIFTRATGKVVSLFS